MSRKSSVLQGQCRRCPGCRNRQTPSGRFDVFRWLPLQNQSRQHIRHKMWNSRTRVRLRHRGVAGVECRSRTRVVPSMLMVVGMVGRAGVEIVVEAMVLSS